ncbi:hypothetical protein L6164_013620 [Bauhinia variegata]|uniref:Uncharacterized protein n=1 Tax=Bauhinia variegata TaxID=167791 RepID=A0ACB9NF20_BAUVA|nr:hypothetical protein L6164_013620 [Bauhinia variegata]
MCVTPYENLNYMCVTAHYIGNDWELNKKILAVCPIADHKGETIGKCLEKIIKEWGIFKVCTVTVDNASSNNVALSYLVRRLNDVHGTILKGEFMHLRCCAHILNLIVSDGLKEIDSSIERIRAAIRYVRSSPQRMSFFLQAAEYVKIDYKKKLCLDVPTRWNSTYLMLDCAEKFEKAFARLEDDDMSYLASFGHDNPPSSDDWKRARVFTKFLKIFYDATLSFSSSLHVTSNVFFHKLIDIQQTLLKWKDSDDFVLKSMAENMHKKFGKYWEDGENFNCLLFVAVVLDPRYKLEYVVFSAVETPLTKEHAFLLLDWIHYPKHRGVPERFLCSIKEGKWLKVTVNRWRPPSKAFFLDSSLGNILQSGFVLVDILTWGSCRRWENLHFHCGTKRRKKELGSDHRREGKKA